ncbi:DNA alkylation repair protein [archaeon]|jgi:3-methyladenine DNA glycosylase AlkD|nr:DNA alkylation repair protein [Candidatus Woesearchaeota archaeon]MBT4135867.1 DNA alkylation repair protein [archaeon]MBT4242227.1 DNA alkylation repair protein [archaeon]MBT4417915.1 DNA alkylation repair protein [archaeon]
MENLNKLLKENANPEKAKILQRFFKTGKGQYGEGDVFLGITVPVQRSIAKESIHLSMEEIRNLLNSEVHEKRLIGLLILIEKFNKGDESVRKNIFDFYLENTHGINNWDLVDLSAHKIVGKFLLDKDRDVLYELAVSEDLWEKRISIVSCFAFIRENDFNEVLNLSEILLNDSHDLIHKAVGWMLREMGKKDVKVLEEFLSKHYKNMPRTMLRYSIEKFPEDKRKMYLRGEV